MKRAKNNKAAGVWQREAAHIKTSHQQDTTNASAATPIVAPHALRPATRTHAPAPGSVTIIAVTWAKLSGLLPVTTSRPLWGILDCLGHAAPKLFSLGVDLCAVCRSADLWAIGSFYRDPIPPKDAVMFFLCEHCAKDATTDGKQAERFAEHIARKAELTMNGMILNPLNPPMADNA